MNILAHTAPIADGGATEVLANLTIPMIWLIALVLSQIGRAHV